MRATANLSHRVRSALARALGVVIVSAWGALVPKAGAEILVTEDEAIREACPDYSGIVTNWVVIEESRISDIKRELGEESLSAAFTYRTITCADQSTNYAAVTTEPGKHGAITFMVILDAELRVVRVVVLDMKEVRGKPIAKQTFLSQYVGKGPDDRLRLGYEVDGVTGATISSTAATVATRKILLYFKAVLGSTATGDTGSKPEGESVDEPAGESAPQP